MFLGDEVYIWKLPKLDVDGSSPFARYRLTTSLAGNPGRELGIKSPRVRLRPNPGVSQRTFRSTASRQY